MRFSLRTLMFLLIPLLIAAYGLAYMLNATVNGQPIFERKWSKELNQLQTWHLTANDPYVILKPSKTTLFGLMQEVLNGKTNTEVLQLGYYQQLHLSDCWEQPYRCVCLDAKHQVVDESQAVEIGFYSVGEDGVSQTSGNDPDDLNSWSSTDAYYAQRHQAIVLREMRLQALKFLPLSLGIFALVGWFLKPFSARSLEWERSRRRHAV